jgi:hypothetical protein
MSRPKDGISESNFVVGVCVRGYDADPAPNLNGIGIYAPEYMGNGVSVEDIGFSTVMMPPHKSGSVEFNGVPDPGQLMACLRTKEPSGATSLMVFGSIPVNRLPGGHPANLNLNTALSALVKAFATEINVNIPPNVRETTENGARVRQIQEKGQRHKHDLLMGIPSHGALYPLAGMIQKQLSNIPTATQSFSNILTSSMMAAVPGTSFSVGNILSSLTSSVADELLSSLAPELAMGMQNTFNLMQSMEINEGGGFSTMGKVDPTTYLANAVNLLKGNQSLGEVISNLQRLQFDSSLFGLDKLASAVFDVPTAFGVMKMSVSPTGEIVNETPDVMQKAIQAFTGLMTSGTGFPSASLSNMFGSSAEIMSSLFDRLPPEKQTNAKNMMEGVVASGTDPRKSLNKISELVNGGDPLSFFS